MELNKGKSFTSGDTVSASDLNSLVDDATIVAGAVTESKLAAGAVTNAKVSADAAIDYSKLATLATGQLIVGSAGTPIRATLGGDATIDASGSLTIAASALPAAIPTGAISMWATSSAPDGWLLCDGSTFDASTYADLNTLLGGNTLPNLQGRVPVGVSSSDGDFDLLDTGGSKTHTLTEAELPSHTHDISLYRNGNESTNTSWFGGQATGSATVTTDGGSGSGNAHNIMQPYIALNFIIKT